MIFVGRDRATGNAGGDIVQDSGGGGATGDGMSEVS